MPAGSELAEPGVRAEFMGQKASLTYCEYWGYGRFGAWRARFWAGKRKFIDFSLDRKGAMVYTNGSGGEREIHRYNKFRWRGLYLRLCLPGMAIVPANTKEDSPDANVFSLPTFALLLGRPNFGRPFFYASR